MAEGKGLCSQIEAQEIGLNHVAPTINETLAPDDAVMIVAELLEAQDHALTLGQVLNITPRDVKAIEATYQQPKERLFHIVIAFLRQQELRPTWRVIVEALKDPLVDLPALARRVEAAHFPDPTSIRDVVPETTTDTANASAPLGPESSLRVSIPPECSLSLAQSAPAMDETLQPDDIADMLDELLPSQHQSYVLGLKLKLPHEEVEAIHCQYLDPIERLLHILLSFTRQKEPRPTWRIIVDALRSPPVNLQRLAMQVEAVHCRDVVPENTADTESTANTTAAGDDVPSSHLNTTAAEVPSSRLSPVSESVEALSKEIYELHSRFNSIKEMTIQSLQKCSIAVMTVVFVLINTWTHGDRLFLKENHKALRQCEDHLELFGRLNFYWNYLAYDLLDHMIMELAKKYSLFDTVVIEMVQYKANIQRFRKSTTLVLFCMADPVALDYEDPPPGFRRMVVLFDWPKTVTLEDVEKFRRRFVIRCDLQTTAMMLNSIMAG